MEQNSQEKRKIQDEDYKYKIKEDPKFQKTKEETTSDGKIFINYLIF